MVWKVQKTRKRLGVLEPKGPRLPTPRLHQANDEEAKQSNMNSSDRLSEIMAEFLKLNPSLTGNLTIRDMAPGAEDILMESFDLSIRTRAYQRPGDSNLVVRKIAPLSRLLVASPAYLRSTRLPFHPIDLKAHNCLNQNEASTDTWCFSKGKNTFEIEVKGTLQANSGLVVRAACLQGLGIGLLSRYMVEDFLKSGQLVSVLGNYQTKPHALYVYYSRTNYMPARTRAFIDFLCFSVKQRAL